MKHGEDLAKATRDDVSLSEIDFLKWLSQKVKKKRFGNGMR